MSVHNAKTNRSAGIKHVVNIYIIMRDKSEISTLAFIAVGERPTPYLLLVKCYGGPDHNLSHLENHISVFALILFINIDKLVATHSCPGLSYLKTMERAMAILNIGLSVLALSVDPNTEKWLMYKVLKVAISTKEVRDDIKQYVTELPLVIKVLERRAQSLKLLLESDS